MSRIILTLLLMLPLTMLGQINNYSIDWNGSTDIAPWDISGVNTFNTTIQWPCEGSHSIRTRLQQDGNQRSATLVSEKIGETDGGVITFEFTYKWLRYSSNQELAGTASQLSMRWQWANSAYGPWYTFATRDGSNHTSSINCTTVTSNFTAYPGDLYVRMVASNTITNGDNYLYIDDISIDEGTMPTCFMPRDIYVANKTKDEFTVNWSHASGQSNASYDIEVRTSGEPGSGAAGLVSAPGLATAVGATSYTTAAGIVNAGTSYKFYIRTDYGGGDTSSWIGIDILTQCAWPEFSFTNPLIVCGVQDVRVQGSNMGSYTFWYNDKDSLLGHGPANNRVFDSVSESFSLKVYSGSFKSLADTILIGNGVTSATDVTPFTNTKAQKVQYIYLANELHDDGFSAGHIKAFGFRVGPSAGTAARNNFTIHMGETYLEQFGTDDAFIPTDRLTLVKGPANDTLQASVVNMFKLDTGFLWDGISNIVVQMTYSDMTSTSNPVATPVFITSYNTTQSYRTIYSRHATHHLPQINFVPTGTRSVLRMNGYFDVIEGCFGPSKEVEILYKEAPSLVLSDSIVNNCFGQAPHKVYLLSGATEYDEFEWELDENHPGYNNTNHPDHPDNAILGDKNIGWIFTPGSSTPITYYLTVKQSNTFPGGEECINYAEVTVVSSPSPTMLQLFPNYTLCTDVIEELKVDNFADERPRQVLFNGNTNGVTLSNGVLGDAITNETAFFSEGNGSLKVSYAAQTAARLNFNETINMFNLNSITIEFDHIAALQATSSNVMDYAYAEYSTDNGVTRS